MIANYNAAQFLSYALFSLYRILGEPAFRKIVVVDNHSCDESLTVLEAFRDAGLIELIANPFQRYHGPALNQALTHLSTQQNGNSFDNIDYIWVLDSDVIILRSDILLHAVTSLQRYHAAILGEFEHVTLHEGYAQPFSMLLNPSICWRSGIPVFHEDGAPAREMQRRLRRLGHIILNFPFTEHYYLLHIGSASVHDLTKHGLVSNRYYGWAKQWEGIGYRYSWSHPQKRIFDSFVALYRKEVPTSNPDALIQACERPGVVNIL